MDPAFVESSKGLKVANLDFKADVDSTKTEISSFQNFQVHDYTPAILKGYKLGFQIHVIPYFEPSFANITESDGSEVHGVLVKLSREDAGMRMCRHRNIIASHCKWMHHSD